MRSLITATAALLLLTALGACASSHTVEGKVITGSQAKFESVSADDPRLGQPGVPGAQLEFIIDPKTSLRPRVIGPLVSDEHGRFEVKLDEFGAGFLEYEMGVMARATGHRDNYEVLPVPSARRKLLIILAPGTPARQPLGPPRPTLDPGEEDLLRGYLP